jgi:hypothetical protein
MAISLAYGVLIGTGFILLFFPVLILTLNDIKVWFLSKWHGKEIVAENVEPAVVASRVSVD